jgi:hypothetical protein
MPAARERCLPLFHSFAPFVFMITMIYDLVCYALTRAPDTSVGYYM